MNKCCCLNLTMQRYKLFLTYTSFLAIIFQPLSFFKGCGGRMLKMLISLHISEICPIFAVSKGRGKTLKYSLRHILFYICIFIRIWGAVWWSLPSLWLWSVLIRKPPRQRRWFATAHLRYRSHRSRSSNRRNDVAR